MRDVPDLIFVSMEDWDDVWRRNQFLCAAYARRHPQSKILFVVPPKDVSHHLRRGSLGQLRGASTWTVPDLPNITVTRPTKWLPNSIAVGRWWNDSVARRHVRRVAAKFGLDRPVLWLNPHYAVRMIGRLGELAAIYDVTDDWTALTQLPAARRLVICQDMRLCRRADAVIVCSERLFDLKRPLAKRLHLIPNGVDAAHYGVTAEGPPVPQRWHKPVLGYTGTIHPDRVDVELVEAVARRWTSGSVVLMGPTHLSPADRSRLLSVGNIVLHPAVPYARLPEYMRSFDVCITPHRVTAFTESLNPIKLWEYLASGRPIVATNVAGFRDYPQLVRIADGPTDFVQACREALVEGSAFAEARRSEARRHSWESRLDAVEAVLECCASSHAKKNGAATS